MGGKVTTMHDDHSNDSSPTARHNGSTADRKHQSMRHHSAALTDSEKELVKQTWRHLHKPPSSKSPNQNGSGLAARNGGGPRHVDENLDRAVESRQLDEIGILVFLRIFEIAPETRDAFPQFRRLTSRADLMDNVLFRCHSRRFVRAVQSVVDNIDSLDIVARPNLELLGRRHRDFAGFKPSYLQAFETAMDEIWLDKLGRRRYGPATRRAWKKVFELITSTVLDGYVEDDAPIANSCCPIMGQKSASIATTNGGLISETGTACSGGDGCVSAEQSSSPASSVCLLSAAVST